MPNTVLAATEGLPTINRRKALTGIIAALGGTAAVVPVLAGQHPAAGATVTPILAKFEEYRTAYIAGNNPDISEDECERIVMITHALEREIVALPLEGPADLAAKLLTVTGFGDYSLDNGSNRHGLLVLAEALQLVGGPDARGN